MDVMATRKPPSGKRKRAGRKGVPIHVWVRPDLRAAVEQAADKNRRTLKEEVSIAIEMYLAGLGFWPPSTNGDQP